MKKEKLEYSGGEYGTPLVEETACITCRRHLTHYCYQCSRAYHVATSTNYDLYIPKTKEQR